ncbi:OsmC family protein [Ulvibacter litoralis]|uniref:Uncharacterized OsmC-related protein n=1 Tax=Ulvibacter litoralis TaxID=227084 RepID=A0A1G7I927_9FLAO|nr:OsmC family protein [Ulvibacter litoralis]GHC62112.1 hypothetical protein GCM10008083_29010 [Ulvibacter litoralis]SDF09195.1 Uncharacterized OsmC-related protein [Ulvibacter litoralis]
MSYTITATSTSGKEGELHLKNTSVAFGTTKATETLLSSPADIYISSLAACILKNIERFSIMMKFEYTTASVSITATHLTKPPRLEGIVYEVIVFSEENNINIELLKRNLEKFGTIYNMVSRACEITGEVLLRKP